MNISKKLMTLLAALALSFGTAACGDDAEETNNGGENGGENGGNGGNGGGNGGDQNTCTEGAFECQGDVLVQCKNKTWDLVDMCGPGACDADAKGCQTTDTPVCDPENFQQECVDQRRYKTCSEDGMKFNIEACGDRMRCNKKTNACEEDPCADCASQGKVCYNDQCVDTIEKGIVGTTCSCNSNCQITIKGKELKDAVNIQIPSQYNFAVRGAALLFGINVDALLAKAQEILDTLGDNDEIKAPNYFSQDITGCDGLEAPEGMVVGCMFTDTITFPQSVFDILDVKIPEFIESEDYTKVMQLVGKFTDVSKFSAETITDATSAVSALLKDGIQFTANKGYCMTADIEIKADLSNMMTEIIPGVFSSDGKTGLASKLNTVNLGTSHDKAKNAECPKGSTLLSYTIDEANGGKIDAVGTFRVGFDMCAQMCITNADCRTEDGYKCVRIPNAAPLSKDDVPPTSQVCFNADMIKYFCDMTNMFPSKDGTTAATCSLSDFVVE